jgi:ribonuclease HI
MTPPSKVSPPGSARLFSDAHPSSPPAGVHIANIDGASRGNPGPASYAVVLRDPAGKIILELGKKFGRDTNNVAEYYALLAALDYATTHAISALRVRSDSELLVRQMQGRYKVKSADLKPLHERASKLSRQLSYFVVEHIPREMNRDADALANLALDQAGIQKFEKVSPASEARPTSSAAASAGPSSLASLTGGRSPVPSRRIRARYVKGALVPTEPLDLPEGTEVSLDLRMPLKD